MAKLRVSPELLSQVLFRDTDKAPIICGAAWENGCVVLDIIGDGVPETDGYIRAFFTSRVPITVEFEKEWEAADARKVK